MSNKTLVVSQKGDGDYKTIAEAINNVREFDRIFIKKGTYREKIFLDKDNIEIVGENKDETIIVFNDHAKIIKNEEPIGTFESYSFYVSGSNFTAKNITFSNDAGRIAQALSIYVDGDKSAFFNCRFLGFQDTIFIGPLPPNPLTVSSFKGPSDGKERKYTRAYFQGCYIEGDIDFIFGSSVSVFKSCEIFSKDKNQDINGYITAASTPKGQEFGLVFIQCELTGDAKDDSVYLGRPWRDYAKTAFIECYMGSHIKKEGWHNWDKKEAENLVEYVEYKNHGIGGRKEGRATFSRELTEEERKKYNIKNIFKDWNLDLLNKEK